VPQGQKYRDAYYQNAQAPQSAPEIVERQIQLDIWEQLPQISSQENQQIGACIHEGGLPLVNARAVVRITSGAGGSKTYPFEPTDSGGCSFLKLDPIQEANGTTIDYEVCFQDVGDWEYCKKDSYLIWGNTETNLSPTEDEKDHTDSAETQNLLTLDVWELHPQLSSTDFQEVGACAHLEGKPQSDLETLLLLETPDQGVISYQSAPTDPGGCTFFQLDPVDAKNGETIPYQVCLINKFGERFCERDSFLIWGNP
jgi:hypothetical protein